MGSNSKRYTDEFKREAVRLLKQSGRPISQVAKEIGVSDTTLGAWSRQDEMGSNKSTRTSLISIERQELQRLREENRTLRMERDLLKKSVAFFAVETRKSSR